MDHDREEDLDAGLSDAEQHPFLPISPETGRPYHRSRHTRTPSLGSRRGRWRWLLAHAIHSLDRRTLVLLGVTTVFSFCLMLYFWFPSTLHVYLAFICITLPISLIFDLCSYAMDRGKSWSRGRTAWFSFTLLVALGVLLPSLALPTPTLYDLASAAPSLPPDADAIPTFPQNHVYYLATNLYNSAALFPDFHDSLLSLISALGPANVFVSVYESNSEDNTKELLKDLGAELKRRGIASRIKLDNIGKDQRHGKEEWESQNTRIDYLARVRNEALRPLDGGLTGLGGREFTRIVWFNDIFYDWKAVLELFNTHGGNFDLACAFDYIPLGFYDTWVARDLCGDRVKPLWPYFRHADDVDFLRHDLPVPVNSCWSGIAAFDAQYYLGSGNATAIYPDSSLPLGKVDKVPTHPANRVNYTLGPPTLPLRFRYDSVCVASECLLAAFDIHRLLHTNTSVSSPASPPPTHSPPKPVARPQSPQPHTPIAPTTPIVGRRPRIYMNPRVVATYDHASYFMYQHLMRWRIVRPWRWFWQDVFAYRFFGWVSDIGRKEALCREAFRNGWAPPPDSRYCPRR